MDELLAGLDAWPAYYAHMAPANAAGPAAPDLSPPERADADQIRKRLAAGEWVVDLRNRVAFAAGHVAGTLNFGLDGSFATYLGWLIPWGTPLTLLGETAEQVAEAQRELVRIGIDRPAAHATGSPADWAGAGELAHASRGPPSPTWPRCATTARSSCSTSAATWNGREAHLDGAVHIPLHELLAGSTRSPTARCGCTAPPATGPRSPRPCWPPPAGASSPSTTTSTGPAPTASRPAPASRAVGQREPGIALTVALAGRHRASAWACSAAAARSWPCRCWSTWPACRRRKPSPCRCSSSASPAPPA